MPSLNKALMGSALLVVEAISKKLVGLISTLILARVLTPEDFGIVAIATLAFGLLEVLGQTGSNQYIVIADKIDDDLLGTAFTYNMLTKLTLAIVFALCTELIADFYEDTRLVPIFYVFAFMLVIVGLQNPMISVLKREQQYTKFVSMMLVCKVVSVIFAISIAIITESYWALVVGQFIAYATPIIGGYIIVPFRPKITLVGMKKQFTFSGWLIPSSLLGYFRTQIDTILISKAFDNTTLGSYHVMKYLSLIPNMYLIGPLTQPLLAQLSSIKDNKSYFVSMYNVSFFVTSAIAFPISHFVFSEAQTIVHYILGPKWSDQAHFLSLFGFLIYFTSLFHIANNLFYIYSNTRLSFNFELIATAVIGGVLILRDFDLPYDFALTKVQIEIFLVIALFLYTTFRFTSLINSLKVLFLNFPIALSTLIASKLTLLIFGKTLTLIHFMFSAIVFFILYGFILVAYIAITREKQNEMKHIANLVLDRYLIIKEKLR